MTIWPAYVASTLHQWAGLDADERAYVEGIIAAREHYNAEGCITGNPLAEPQGVVPLWTVMQPNGERIDLVALKEEIK